MHVAEGTDFGWRLRYRRPLLPAGRCPRLPSRGELPGKVPPMIKTGRGSPAGLLIYNDTRIPQQYRGLLYYPDVFRKLVRAYKVAAGRLDVSRSPANSSSSRATIRCSARARW